MTQFKVATFNVKNLIGPGQEYYQFETYTSEEYEWKKSWLARQLLSMDADIVCFQEIFDEEALWDVIEETNRRGEALNRLTTPDDDSPYKGRAIFRKIRFEPYKRDQLRFSANANDGAPGQRRPGLAILSRFGFKGAIKTTQVLEKPLSINYPDLGGGDAGQFTLTRTSRPIQRATVRISDTDLRIYNIHFKSKLGEFARSKGAKFPREADLTNYDALGRAMGELRAANRRMAEAVVLRSLVLRDLEAGNVVMALGDFNDGAHSVPSAIVSGERPFRNYSWMRRHNARHRDDRYSSEENEKITAKIKRLQLNSAEAYFVRRSLNDTVFTSAFGGVYESIDQILLSRHFDPENKKRRGDVEYLTILNDHLTDGSHPEAPYNKLASDHGQLVAHLSMRD